VIASGLPVSLYGIGSFRLVTLKKTGRQRLKMYLSESVSSVLEAVPDNISGEDFMSGFWGVFRRYVAEDRKKDPSVLEASQRLVISLD
jgi:hypothetical protein